MAYFGALSEELPAVTLPADATELPIRALCDVQVDTSRRAHVETFFGARLGDWAASCIASPYGLLFTRVAGWPTTTMRTTGGQSFEVATLDEPDAARSGRTFSARMDALAAARDIEVFEDHPLQRIVFEDGRIAGVVVDSEDGPWAVRARVGIVVTAAQPCPADDRILDADSRIALVGLAASRFGRVEVLHTVDAPQG
jgi:FAD binding domain